MNKLDQLVSKSIEVYELTLPRQALPEDTLLCGQLQLKVVEHKTNGFSLPYIKVYVRQFGFPTFLGEVEDIPLHSRIYVKLEELHKALRLKEESKLKVQQQTLIDSLLEEISAPQNYPPQNYPPMPV